MTNPIFDYGRSDGCVSITGGAFVPNSSGWPAAYLGTYLFADYGCGKIFRLDPNGGGFLPTDFAGFLGAGFTVAEPPELVEQVRLLAARYTAAASPK